MWPPCSKHGRGSVMLSARWLKSWKTVKGIITVSSQSAQWWSKVCIPPGYFSHWDPFFRGQNVSQTLGTQSRWGWYGALGGPGWPQLLPEQPSPSNKGLGHLMEPHLVPMCPCSFLHSSGKRGGPPPPCIPFLGFQNLETPLRTCSVFDTRWWIQGACQGEISSLL